MKLVRATRLLPPAFSVTCWWEMLSIEPREAVSIRLSITATISVIASLVHIPVFMTKARNAAHAEEKAEVEVLSADAIKYGELAKKLRALQASLEGGGRTVRDAIGPVHSNTRDHQIMIHSMEISVLNIVYANIELSDIGRLDAHIDKMLEPGQDKGKEERIIRAGYVVAWTCRVVARC